MRKILDDQLESIRDAGTWKVERVITSKQAASIQVQGGNKVLNFCANNYLGLSSHPAVIEAGKQALDTHGSGLSSTRFICGTTDIHKELENKIAKFHNVEDAALYASCFDANAGLFEILLSKDDAVLSDELNHASIIDGIRLCKAMKYRYKHMDMEDLESKLHEAKNARMRMIVTDGVFSMDGDVSPLPAICELGEKYDAMVFVDDCHGTGFFGKTGRGSGEHCGVEDKIDIINSTLGKALGGAAGGYTAGARQVTDLIRQKARPYLFSNTLPPPVVACASKALDLLMESSELIDQVTANTKRFRERMTDAGFKLGGDPCHPIAPVMFGDARLAATFADEMLKKGIFVIGFSFPVVPMGKARIRVQLSAAHSFEEIDRCVDAFVDIGRELKVI
ncbi:2-amino-3-ketobutyrate coenzyme A ligase, mitochondrial-like [Lineus longissimus]|uniref:2-amino-3-ketobutyrate coenzyme A ligase, mitochondrial-like n=1 Tax=Lineus longissimus TaxID=88925 RepID=UPI00315E01AD